MIPDIKEINFGPGTDNSYATLHQATVSLAEMGDRTITAQVRIDGDVIPSFDDWALEFKGERFVLPTDTPQATKDNTTRNSLVDLTFESQPVQDLKRYFFFEPVSIDANTAIADKYKASVNLNIEDFIVLFNKVLEYYFGGTVVAQLYMSGQGIYSTEAKPMEIDYTYIWDVIVKTNETYDIRWKFVEDNGITYLRFGYPDSEIPTSSHIFEYGYNGGLLKFERQVQDQDLHNILLGRGGEKNLPYRYFKRTDPGNPGWTADPDAIPELANIYFDRLRDINFRWYVRGWMKNPNRDTSWEQQGYVYPNYSASDAPAAYRFAYEKGASDDKFNPVEYVKDDDSILQYGERWGALDDNDDIFPTIQGKGRLGLGRIDEIVGVSQIVTDDIDAMSNAAAVEQNISSVVRSVLNDTNKPWVYELDSVEFTIPQGKTGNIRYIPLSKPTENEELVFYDTTETRVTAVNSSGTSVPISDIRAGTYRLHVHLVVAAGSIDINSISGTFGIEGIVLTIAEEDADAWKPTFDIWVKNIWNTTKGQNESDLEYALRVWEPILGDRVGNEAKVVFSTGFMSISEDYEFVIVDYPVFDQSKRIQTTDINGDTITVDSEWRITLRKSDAEYDATGLFIPNSTTGGSPSVRDKFFFTGIDMPFDYVMWAEEDLNTYKDGELRNQIKVNPTWVINLDKVRINTIEDADNGQLLADLLSSGTKIHVTDKRFAPNGLTLYVRQITYTWNEPTDDNPYLFPDVEVVLSQDVNAVSNSYSKLQGEVSSIKANYVSASDVEAVVRQVAAPMFLKKTGESDDSASPTTFASKVSSRGFRSGEVGGEGWGLYSDNSEQFEGDPDAPMDSVLEIDKLIVRKEMNVNSLVVNQISYAGGKEIISAAKIEVTNVVEDQTTYTCYFNQRQNSVANLFVVGDIAYGQVYTPGNATLRYYKMVVSDVDVDRIVLAKENRDGAGAPAIGDVIVQYGNTTDSSRQYVIIRDVIGGGYERMISGLNSTRANGTEYYFAGRQTGQSPRWFVGEKKNLASDQYIEYANGKLTLKGVLDVTDTNASTTISGNLIQTGTIQLGSIDNNDEFHIWSGLSGEFDNNALGNGIAAWYGGSKVDHEASPSAQDYARSIFRFDGSGYLAGGLLNWGVSNGSAFLRLNGKAVIGGLDGTSLNDIANLLFDVVEYDQVNHKYAVRLKSTALNSDGDEVTIDGLFSNGFLSGGGLNSVAGGGGGGGGSLNQVVINGSGGISVTGSPIQSDLDSITVGIASGRYLPTTSDKTAWDAKQNALGFTPFNAANVVQATGNSTTKVMSQKAVTDALGAAGGGTITGITMNGQSMGTSGVVDLGTVITSLAGYLTSSDAANTYQTKLNGTTNKLNPSYIDTDNDHLWWTSALATTLNSKASDSAVVHLAGTETISGEKTFTNIVNVLGWNYLYSSTEGEAISDALYAKQDMVSRLGGSTTPVYVDRDGHFTTCTQYAGGSRVKLNGGSYKTGQDVSFYAPTGYGTRGQYLVTGGSGSSPTWASAGSVASGSDALVTGGTVYTALQNYALDNAVVHLSNSETISGDKTFTGNVEVIGWDYLLSTIEGETLSQFLATKADASDLSDYLLKTDFRFDILCKSTLPTGSNLNTVFDTTRSDITGKMAYYAYVEMRETTSGSGVYTAGQNGFPVTTNANALLTIGTYSDATSQYLYQMGFSSDGNIYYRDGYAVKTNDTWGPAFENDNRWKRIIAEDYNGNITLRRGKQFFLDDIVGCRAYIQRGSAGVDPATQQPYDDRSLYIDAGLDANNNIVPLHIHTSALCPNSPNDNSNIGSSWAYWNNIYARRWYPDPSNQSHYIEYDSSNSCFRIHGPLVVDGQVSAGGLISNS